MNPGWLGRERITLDSVDSTSAELWRRVTDGATHGTVVRAEVQTAGRGRQGRHWRAGPGNLLVSWLVRNERAPERPGLLSIIEGLALCAALEPLAPGRIRLKWPNDLLLDGRKLGGLLLEVRSAGGFHCVSGLGLNLRTPREGWGELEGRAIALDTVLDDPVPEAVLDRLLPELEGALDGFLAGEDEPLLAGWSRWSALDRAPVQWEDGGGTGAGTVRGLAPDGGLEVTTTDGVELVLHAADVHLRGQS